MLFIAADFVKKVYPQTEVVYGDTDSIFVNFKPTDENGNRLKGKAALKKSIGIEVEKRIDSVIKYPHCLEYEKTFWPFILFTKKDIGNKYEFDHNKYKQTSKVLY